MFFQQKVYKPICAEVKKSLIHGRGVFAVKNIRKGALIEEAPAIFLCEDEKDALKLTPLFNYYFLVGNTIFPAVFGFGYSSFYNHSSNANCFYTFSLHKKIITFYAFREITDGEEITINYNGDPENDKPVYFPANE